MKMRLLGLLVIYLLAFASCKKAVVEEVCSSPTEISFKRDIQPIFNANCATSGCHTGNKSAGGLNLEASVSFENLNDAKSGYLDTLDPSSSLLYTSIMSVANPMPPNGKMSKCNTDLILKWIQQKAKNN